MRAIIITPTDTNKHQQTRAIVRGDLALHIAIWRDGRKLNEWAVTYIPTGQLIIIMRGAYAGRIAFRMLSSLSFERRNKTLMHKCNAIVNRLRKQHLTVLFPRSRYGAINEPVITTGAPL